MHREEIKIYNRESVKIMECIFLKLKSDSFAQLVFHFAFESKVEIDYNQTIRFVSLESLSCVSVCLPSLFFSISSILPVVSH